MGPSSDVLWRESDGFYLKSQGPISGGAIGLGVGVLGLGAGFMLPWAVLDVAGSPPREVYAHAQSAQMLLIHTTFNTQRYDRCQARHKIDTLTWRKALCRGARKVQAAEYPALSY